MLIVPNNEDNLLNLSKDIQLRSKLRRQTRKRRDKKISPSHKLCEWCEETEYAKKRKEKLIITNYERKRSEIIEALRRNR